MKFFQNLTFSSLSTPRFLFFSGETPGLHSDTLERIAELRRRAVEDTKLELLELEIGQITNARFGEFQKEFETKSPDFTAEDLKSLADFCVDQSLGAEKSKLYRTEMVARANDFLKAQPLDKVTSAQASQILLNAMEALRYSNRSAEKALWDSMRMIHYGDSKLSAEVARRFNGKHNRAKLAQEMENSPHQSVPLGKTISLEEGVSYRIIDCEILTGGAMTNISPELLETFVIKNAIWAGENKILAQMENGCEGNLVIIEIGDPEDTPPADDIIPGPLSPGEFEPGDEHIAADSREFGRGIPAANQEFDEKIKTDINAKFLRENYDQAAIAGLLTALESIPDSEKPAALGEFFETLGKSDPAKAAEAMKALNEVITKDMGAIEAEIEQDFDEKIANASNGSEKALWEAQKEMFVLSRGKIAPQHAEAKIKENYIKLKSIDNNNLPPELQEMHVGVIAGIEIRTTQLMALDMVRTAQGTLDQTFTDWDDLKEFEAQSDSEKKESFENKWLSGNVLDTDEEAYFAATEIHAALDYLIQYQYPLDVTVNKRISNPVSYYTAELEKNGGKITPVPGAPTPPTFVHFGEELRLFNDYQSGDIDMGEFSFLSDWDGDGGAFMGQEQRIGVISHSNFGGLVRGSERIFSAPSLIDENINGDIHEPGKLGAFERLRLTKIGHAEAYGRYDEARAMCIETLSVKITAPTTSEIQVRTDQIILKEGSKISAQVRQRLEAKGITSSNIASQNIPNPAGGHYTSLSDLIHDRMKDLLGERAHIQLYGEKAAGMDVNSSALSQFEKANLEILQRLNGKDWRPSAENRDFTLSTAKTITEIIVAQAITGGIAGFVGGAMAIGRAGAMGSRTIALSRGLGAQRVGARMGAGVRRAVMEARPYRIIAPRLTHRAGWRGADIGRYFAEGSTWHARAAGNVLHSTAFMEVQALMHGNLVDPTSAEGAYQIATMAGTFWALGKMQQALRGQTMSMQRAARGGGNRVEKILGNKGLRAPGDFLQKAANSGKLGRAGVSSFETGLELVAFHQMTELQEYLGVLGYETTEKYFGEGLIGMSQTQREAMQETEAFRRWGHEAAVLLGLRTWRKARTMAQRTTQQTTGPNAQQTPPNTRRNAPNTATQTAQFKHVVPIKSLKGAYEAHLNQSRQFQKNGKSEAKAAFHYREMKNIEVEVKRRGIDFNTFLSNSRKAGGGDTFGTPDFYINKGVNEAQAKLVKAQNAGKGVAEAQAKLATAQAKQQKVEQELSKLKPPATRPELQGYNDHIPVRFNLT